MPLLYLRHDGYGSILIARLVLLCLAARVFASCQTPGPAFPPLRLTNSSPSLKELTTKLNDVISGALDGEDTYWSESTTSFAIQLTSADETLWSSYFTAKILGEYKDSEPTLVTGDTAFRAASITKTFTVYALLLEKRINLEDAITKYLPALKDGHMKDKWAVDFDQITIRSLASQLSGIARETGQSDLALDRHEMPEEPVKNGFPPIRADDEHLGPCQKTESDRPCTASDVIGRARNRSMVFYPNYRSTYSNVAYSLLGLALENVTGQAFPDIIASSILEPLGMHSTSFSKPKDAEGVIPYGFNNWRTDLGADNPTGGIYCTANDFSKYLRSILSSLLLPRAVTNAWLKPHSWGMSGVMSATGMPWEILRSTKLTKDGRGVDVITKAGGLWGYSSLIVLMPEFGLGMTILVAGDHRALGELTARLTGTIVSAFEEFARTETRRAFAGSYAAISARDSLPSMNSSLVLAVDDVGPGIRIAAWISRDVDFLKVYGHLKGMPDDKDAWEARLIPSNLEHDYGTVREEIWRATATLKPNAARKSSVWDDFCLTDVDFLTYGGFSIEEFRFIRGRNGEVESVVLNGLRITLFKEERSSQNSGPQEIMMIQE
ncbi:hypothetical protein MMC26_004159 [Xylographa opegraphella]|nr:hypothetical protein [Xylographa opegraphella]